MAICCWFRSRELVTDSHSHMAMEQAPATRPASPVRRMVLPGTEAPATSVTRPKLGRRLGDCYDSHAVTFGHGFALMTPKNVSAVGPSNMDDSSARWTILVFSWRGVGRGNLYHCLIIEDAGILPAGSCRAKGGS